MLNLKPYDGTLGFDRQCCARARCERSVESLLNFRRAVPARRKERAERITSMPPFYFRVITVNGKTLLDRCERFE
jgi:hypothetical protein